MSSPDRVGLLSDTYALCKARYVKANILLSLLEHFEHETNPTVLESLESILSAINRITGDKYIQMTQKIVTNIFNRYGFEGLKDDDFESKVSRSIALRMMVKYNWENTKSIKL